MANNFDKRMRRAKRQEDEKKKRQQYRLDVKTRIVLPPITPAQFAKDLKELDFTNYDYLFNFRAKLIKMVEEHHNLKFQMGGYPKLLNWMGESVPNNSDPNLIHSIPLLKQLNEKLDAYTDGQLPNCPWAIRWICDHACGQLLEWWKLISPVNYQLYMEGDDNG